MELLRFVTSGSVDDGKSTLIGRLLHDSKSIFEDQMAAVETASARRGHEQVDLSLLTDGLRAEREQGITIDVAYRYFATPRRSFVIADTPGHVQYTRNMVTGASTADLALILVDARKGMLEQTRRHAFIATLLGIPHLAVCINKMDLVEWSEARFTEVTGEFEEFALGLDVKDVAFIPISALRGDNVVEPSTNMPWYRGVPLLSHLETVDLTHDTNDDGRFPVQYVISPQGDYRGYAGQVASGAFRVGDPVLHLPSGETTTISGIDTLDGALDTAVAPLSVTLRLADHLDVSRGDMLSTIDHPPTMTSEVTAMVCWMTAGPLRAGRRFAIKHTTRTARAVVEELVYRLDVNTLEEELGIEALQLNDIGLVRLRISEPLMVDDYRRNRTTGSFILIDEGGNATAGAGMIVATGSP